MDARELEILYTEISHLGFLEVIRMYLNLEFLLARWRPGRYMIS